MKFFENSQSTLQASFLTKTILINNESLTLNIWDTAGQERFHAVGPLYYRDSNGALLVYDVTDADSLAKVKVWIKELRKILGSDVCLAIVGNKIDLLDGQDRQQLNNALITEAKNLAKTANATHYCTSAKANFGIDDLFINLTKQMSSVNQTQQLNQRASNSAFTTRGITIAADNTETNNHSMAAKGKCC
ncbi:ras-related protein Ral-A [Sarcoptes scabiei]|nr:ras-related protein Ral-A [Sarcoptes scabiei]